ncbi:unnamed protein product [Gordionus sp. m RMFG-2023]
MDEYSMVMEPWIKLEGQQRKNARTYFQFEKKSRVPACPLYYIILNHIRAISNSGYLIEKLIFSQDVTSLEFFISTASNLELYREQT